jgi:uncharacterized surface protein with fasciclin (FAS1) repeats
MKSVITFGFVALLGAAIGVGEARSLKAEPAKDIVATAVESGKFKTLAIALDKAGLVETLKGKGPFTVFAPTDEAFAKIPEATLKAVLNDKEKLTKILMAHVVVGKSVMSSDVAKLDGTKVNGFTISTKGGVKVGNANVVKADIGCSNGVIHVIDSVLIPE